MTNAVILGNLYDDSGWTFLNCYALEKVILSKSVTHIPNNVFHYCNSLTDIYYEGSESDWEKIERAKYIGELTNVTIHYNYVLGE